MTATPSPKANATAAKSWLDVLDERAEELCGATTEVAKAKLLGVNITTLWRWRRPEAEGGVKPGRDKAIEIARLLDIPVEQVLL